METAQGTLQDLLSSGKRYREISELTGLTVEQIKYAARKAGLRKKHEGYKGNPLEMPNLVYTPVPLREPLVRCPMCQGTVNFDGHSMISYCEGACGQEWRLNGTPIPREEWLRLVTL